MISPHGARLRVRIALMTSLPTLPPPLPAATRILRGRAGEVALHVAGQGPPMLMLHSINAAASAYEIRPAFEAMLSSHRVFAPDLPGFGSSERSDRRYDVPLYVNAIEDALDAIQIECGAMPVDVLALSTSCEFAARAALRLPHRVRSLALVSATGLDRRSERWRGPEGSSREVKGVHAVLTWPVWTQGVFDLLVTRPSVRFFLRKTWGSRQIDDGLLDYCVRSAHQPGARHAPLAFLSARLFSADIRNVYDQLAVPVWLAHGVRGDFQDFTGADAIVAQGRWRRDVFQTGALPHFEQPQAFAAAYQHFLDRIEVHA